MSSRALPRASRLATILVTLGACPLAPLLAQQPSPVHVEAVRSESLVQRRQVTGNVRAVHRSAVAAREKGVVLELAVREGQPVADGDVLARQDASRLELELTALRAQLAPGRAAVREAEATVEQARRDLGALDQLAGKNATTPKELADARTALAGAEAGQARAEGELGVLDARIADLADRVEDMVIRAPFAGTVTARRTEVGAWLGEGHAVVELVSTSELEIWLEVPQQHLGALAQGGDGESVRVVVDATGEAHELTSWRVVPDVAVSSRTFRLLGRVEDTPALAPGMSVTAEIPTGARADHLTMSRDALLRNQAGPYVYLVMPGGEGQPASAAPLQVEVLFHLGERVAVRAPRLAAGARVVVEGNERLFPMAPIQPMEAEADDPAPGGDPAGAAGDAPRGEGRSSPARSGSEETTGEAHR